MLDIVVISDILKSAQNTSKRLIATTGGNIEAK